MKYTDYLLSNAKESTVEAKLQEAAEAMDDYLKYQNDDEVEVYVDQYFDPTKYFTKRFLRDYDLMTEFGEYIRHKMAYENYLFSGVLGRLNGDKIYTLSLVFERAK